MRRLGFVEGQNLIVDSRGHAVRTEEFPAVVAELVKAQTGELETALAALEAKVINPDGKI